MKNDERYCFSDFTRRNYRRLLRMAKRHYIFSLYDDFDRNTKFVLWRHDVDTCLESAVALARIEADEGVRATYTLWLHSSFYNLLENRSTERVRTLIALGHRVGLHFDAAYYGVRDIRGLVRYLGMERHLLERAWGCDVRMFSFHDPTPRTDRCLARTYADMVNATSGFLRNEAGYCSDSNGYWRHRRLEDVLREAKDDRLQVLTHPEWWQASVLSPKERIHLCVDRNADETKRRYALLLKTARRKNIGG